MDHDQIFPFLRESKTAGGSWTDAPDRKYEDNCTAPKPNPCCLGAHLTHTARSFTTVQMRQLKHLKDRFGSLPSMNCSNWFNYSHHFNDTLKIILFSFFPEAVSHIIYALIAGCNSKIDSVPWIKKHIREETAMTEQKLDTVLGVPCIVIPLHTVTRNYML